MKPQQTTLAKYSALNPSGERQPFPLDNSFSSRMVCSTSYLSDLWSTIKKSLLHSRITKSVSINKVPIKQKFFSLSTLWSWCHFWEIHPFLHYPVWMRNQQWKSHVKIKIKELECEQDNYDVTSLARKENSGTQNSWNGTPHCCNSWSIFSKWCFILRTNHIQTKSLFGFEY